MTNISAATKEWLGKKGEFLVTRIDFETLNQLAAWIVDNRPQKTKFTIVIDSSGGSPAAAVHFASFAGTLGKEVELTGVAFGECGSAALAILQCCHERIAVRHCGFFIHHIQSTVNTSPHLMTPKRFREEIIDVSNLEKELVRMQCKRTGMSVKAWNRLADRSELVKNRPIFPEEALKLGLVDKVVERYPIF